MNRNNRYIPRSLLTSIPIVKRDGMVVVDAG